MMKRGEDSKKSIRGGNEGRRMVSGTGKESGMADADDNERKRKKKTERVNSDEERRMEERDKKI